MNPSLNLLEVANRLNNAGNVADALRVKAADTILREALTDLASAEEMRRALANYGKHDMGCAKYHSLSDVACTCGLDAALQRSPSGALARLLAEAGVEALRKLADDARVWGLKVGSRPMREWLQDYADALADPAR